MYCAASDRALYCVPATLTGRPLRTSRSAVSTTSCASSHIHSGTASISIPARWWNSVCVKPGHTAVTCTPVPANSMLRLSLNTVTHAFAAE